MNRFFSKSILTLTLLCAGAFSSLAQDISGLLNGSKSDAAALLKAYMAPGLNAIGTGLNANWNTSAGHSKIIKVEFRVTPSFVMPSSSEKQFDVNSLGLSSLALKDPSQSMAPTLLGKDSNGPELVEKSTGTKVATLPKGYGSMLGGIPVPLSQFTIGSGFVKSTELSVRFIPSIGFGDASISMFGIGVKHDIKQWIPIMSKIPLLDLSASLAYSKLNFDYKNIGGVADLKTSVAGYNAEAIASLGLPIITPYLAVGYGRSSYNMDLTKSAIGNINLKGDKNNVYGTLGAQVSLFMVVRLYASYTVGTAYNIFNAGAGLGFSL